MYVGLQKHVSKRWMVTFSEFILGESSLRSVLKSFDRERSDISCDWKSKVSFEGSELCVIIFFLLMLTLSNMKTDMQMGN